MESYSLVFRVCDEDVDNSGRLKIVSLMGYLQEVAIGHANELKLSYEDLIKKDLAWAMSKMIIDINTLPKLGEFFQIRTWSSSRERICTYREFEVLDSMGNILIEVRSQWVLFDIHKRRIVRLEVLDTWKMLAKYAKHLSFEEALETPKLGQCLKDFEVEASHTDKNNHVNNRFYIDWALQTLPEEFIKTHTIKQVRINFLEELFLGDTLSSECDIYALKSLHKITSKTKTSSTINIFWRL